MTTDSALVALERRVAADLHAIRFPDQEWVIPTTGPEDTHVYDVVIVGAGHCGLTVAFALRRRGITNIQVLEAREAGAQGPWTTYGRMLTLRSPKHFNGPDLDIPSLTCEAWYTARYGPDSWNSLHRIPKDDWQEYLLWFRRVTGVPVAYQTQLTYLSPGSGSHHLAIHGPTGPDHLHARKVVFATGAEGSGGWTVPDVVRNNVPVTHYTQVADPVDFAALRGKRVGVLGGGASAYDNAATALEYGAARVDLFFRRPDLHRINPHKWTEFSGFLNHFRDLPDHWRWRFMRHVLPLNEPPPPDTFQRATRHPNFTLRLGSSWDDIHFHDDQIDVTSNGRHSYFDHLLIAVGLTQDLRLRPELADIEPHIARWADMYAPPDGEEHDGLAKFPYLGPYLEYTERTPGTAPYLADIYNFTAAATVSHGPSGASINGMKQAANRLVDGISKSFFEQSVNDHYNNLLEFDQMELDVPWPPTASDDVPARADEIDASHPPTRMSS